MSSPISALLKRPDELFVVEHAHLRPRFVEDSVRAALKTVLDGYPELDDGDFLLSRQVNLETIHDHDVIAERHGTVGELRAELEAAASRPRTRSSATGCGPSQSPPNRLRSARLVHPAWPWLADEEDTKGDQGNEGIRPAGDRSRDCRCSYRCSRRVG